MLWTEKALAEQRPPEYHLPLHSLAVLRATVMVKCWPPRPAPVAALRRLLERELVVADAMQPLLLQ